MKTILLVFMLVFSVIGAGILLEGKQYFLVKRHYGGGRTLRQELKRRWQTLRKCCHMALLPVPFTLASIVFWKVVLYDNGLSLDREFEGIGSAAWIAVHGLLYSLGFAVILTVIWAEYKTLRMAVKKYDLDTFMDLRDEQMSPLVHTLLITLSVTLLGGFMAMKYSSAVCGAFAVGTMAYVLAMIFFVVVEIDDPCQGIWVIKSIPQEWLALDAKAYRAKRNQDRVEKFGTELLKQTPAPAKVEKPRETCQV